MGDAVTELEYKASLAKIFPSRVRNFLFEYQRCVFGISLGSQNFIERGRLEASVRWIDEHFNACLIFVPDSVYRLTLEVERGANCDEYQAMAFQRGQEFLDKNRDLFDECAEKCNFVFMRSSIIEQSSEFSAYYRRLQNYYQTNEFFAGLVDAFAEDYLGRVGQVKEKMALNLFHQYRQLAIDYLLQEYSLASYLVQEGWYAFVYPGSVKTFELIAERKCSSFPLPIEQMVWISLRLKRRKRR